jgi:ParB/RepB/Spo0J family partition protein
MPVETAQAMLKHISVDHIHRNPDNPRLIFQPSNLEDLLLSISRYGIQVPISVYREGRTYVLIDGERRWRCCLKLNKRTIPALVQEKPDPLTNLLLMFNIHALREQWDLLTIALKLPKIIKLLTRQDGSPPTERELSEHTGLRRGVIRRCRLLMDLPDVYQQEILKELNKPKSDQLLTEDFFIEMERALKTVENAMPGVIPKKDDVRQVLIQKFKDKVIDNRVHFRQIAKIARADNIEADRAAAERALHRLFQKNKYSIERAYQDSVSEAYSERDLLTRVNSLIDQLEDYDVEALDDEVRRALRELVRKAKVLLGGER